MRTLAPRFVQDKMSSAQLWWRNSKFQSKANSNLVLAKILSEICSSPDLLQIHAWEAAHLLGYNAGQPPLGVNNMSIWLHMINQYSKFNSHVFF
jgi:hypothetical protein